MVSPSLLGRWALLAALTAACRRPTRPTDAGTRPLDRPIPTDRPAPVDATADARADVPGERPPPLDLFVVGGSGMMRPDASVQLRVERVRPGQPRPEDVTGQVRFTVDPADRGVVTDAGVFVGRSLGRARIIATLGAERVETIQEVSTELPPGVAALPRVTVSDGRVAHSVRLDARPDGTVTLDVEAERLALHLAGRRTRSAFPMSIVAYARREGGAELPDAGPATPVGTIVLERWVPGRLDGHAAVRVDGQALTLRFSVSVGDASVLRSPLPPS